MEMDSSASMSQDVVKSAPSVSAGQIPDLLKIGSIQSNVQMSVDTDVLDPVVQNSRFIRYVLQNKGILHSHSKLQFGYSSPVGEDGWLPINIGIGSLIQRATLRIGNQTISEVDDWANFQHYKSQFMSSESMRERLPYLTGQMMSKKVAYNIEGDQWSSADPPTLIANEDGGGSSGGKDGAAPTSQSHGLVIDSGRSFYSPVGTYEAQRPATEMPPYMNTYKDTVDGVYTDTPTWQIALSDLFPFLKTNQLPLYMMKEQISLELVLTEPSAKGRGWVASGGAAATSFVLDTTKTKMFADYQYYPQEMMVAYANANSSLQFSYTDYRLSKLSFASDTTGQQIRNLGGAGRIITKVMFAWTDNDSTRTTAATSPIMVWNAAAPYRTGTNVNALPPVAQDANEASDNLMGSIALNLKYNNGFLFPMDVDNKARLFHNVVQAEGLVPYSSREEFSREGLSLSERTLQGYSFSGALSGTAFWNAFRLNRGERVNSRGLELYSTIAALPAANANYTLRAYLETIKFVSLKDGMVSSFLA